MAEKLTAYSAGSEPAFPSTYDVVKRYTLNFTDIVKNNNKFYNAEIQVATSGEARIFTCYGRTGGTMAKEYRMCRNQSHAETEAANIIKGKLKKGYVEVKLIKAEVGSEVGKSKVESSVVTEDQAKKLGIKVEEETPCTLHISVQSLIKSWFGSLEQFVIDTLDTSKCALGQLSLDQISKGKDLLLDARTLVTAGAKDITELNNITSKYYSNIPMNFGYRRLDANLLRFDTHDKLDKAFEILETLEGAKSAEKVLTKRSGVEDKYKTLNTGISYVDPSDPVWKWIDTMFHKTRASNHAFLGKMRVNNVFALTRNKEYEEFTNFISKMDRSKNSIELPDVFKPIWSQRVKENKELEELYNSVNCLPLFHGTRTPNFPKIISSRLMMRKPGFTVAGAAFDKFGALYFSNSSTKSINYSSAAGSYWSSGSDKRAYLFLSDVALGKQKIVTSAYPYTLEGIKPCMSVWAKPGNGGFLINDEYIVYTEKQNWLRYVIEFETQIR